MSTQPAGSAGARNDANVQPEQATTDARSPLRPVQGVQDAVTGMSFSSTTPQLTAFDRDTYKRGTMNSSYSRLSIASARSAAHLPASPIRHSWMSTPERDFRSASSFGRRSWSARPSKKSAPEMMSASLKMDVAEKKAALQQSEITKLKKRLRLEQDRIREIDAQLQHEQAHSLEKDSQLRQARLELQAATERESKLRSKLAAAEEEARTLRAELTALRNAQHSSGMEELLRGRRAELQAKVDELNEENAAKNRELLSTKQQLNQLQLANSDLQQQLASQRRSMDSLREAEAERSSRDSREIDQLKSTVRSLETRLEAFGDSANDPDRDAGFQDVLSNLEMERATVAKLNARIGMLEPQLTQEQKAFQLLLQEKKDLAASKEQLEQQFRDLQESSAAKLRDLTAEHSAAVALNKDLKARYEDMKSSWTAQQEQVAVLSTHNNQINVTKTDMERMLTDVRQKAAESEGILKGKMETMEVEIRHLRQSNSEYMQANKEVEGTVRVLQEQLRAKAAECSSLKDKMLKLEQQHRENQQRLETLQKANLEWQKTAESLRHRLELSRQHTSTNNSMFQSPGLAGSGGSRRSSFFGDEATPSQLTADLMSTLTKANELSKTQQLLQTPPSAKGKRGSAASPQDSASTEAALTRVVSQLNQVPSAILDALQKQSNNIQQEMLRAMRDEQQVVADKHDEELRKVRKELQAIHGTLTVYNPPASPIHGPSPVRTKGSGKRSSKRTRASPAALPLVQDTAYTVDQPLSLSSLSHHSSDAERSTTHHTIPKVEQHELSFSEEDGTTQDRVRMDQLSSTVTSQATAQEVKRVSVDDTASSSSSDDEDMVFSDVDDEVNGVPSHSVLVQRVPADAAHPRNIMEQLASIHSNLQELVRKERSSAILDKLNSLANQLGSLGNVPNVLDSIRATVVGLPSSVQSKVEQLLQQIRPEIDVAQLENTVTGAVEQGNDQVTNKLDRMNGTMDLVLENTEQIDNLSAGKGSSVWLLGAWGLALALVFAVMQYNPDTAYSPV